MYMCVCVIKMKEKKFKLIKKKSIIYKNPLAFNLNLFFIVAEILPYLFVLFLSI